MDFFERIDKEREYCELEDQLQDRLCAPEQRKQVQEKQDKIFDELLADHRHRVANAHRW